MKTKPSWYYNQSAVIPFKTNEGMTEIVLITSITSGAWGIPKGVVEKSMSPEESASKEAFEEAGVIGKVSNEIIADYEYEKWGGTCKVKVFPLHVTDILDEWDERNVRKRIIVEIKEAISLIKKNQREVLIKFQEIMSINYCNSAR